MLHKTGQFKGGHGIVGPDQLPTVLAFARHVVEDPSSYRTAYKTAQGLVPLARGPDR